MNQTLKRVGVAGAFLGLAAGAGMAYAAWNANGTGSGSAKAITAQAVTLTGDTNTPQLYPGGSGDVVVKVTNPNPYPIRVTAYNRTASAITSDAGSACDASTGVTVDNVTGRTDDVGPNTSATFTLVGAAHMSNASDTTCSGASFTIPLSVVAASNA